MNWALIAAGFLFLTRSEAPKHGVTRASIDPARFDAAVETAVYRELPARHLVRTWHAMDSKVLLLVPFDRESTAEYFRRRCGFVAWRGGADGVLVPDELSAPFAEALKAAKEDVATCERLAALAEKCRTKPEPLRTEGRRAKAALHLMRVKTADLDCLRLENVVRAERLAKMLGEPCGLERAVPRPFADEPEMNVDTTGFTELRLDFDAKSVAGGGEIPVKVSAAPFLLRFQGKGERALAKPPFPGGRWKARLWIQTEDGFLPYRYELYLRRPDELPVPVRRPAAPYCNLERRFGPVYGEEPYCDRVKDVPVRTRSPDYPDLLASVSASHVGETGWLVTFSLKLDGLFRRLPSVTPGRADVWYLELDDDRGRATRLKLVWPTPADRTAAEANRARLMKGIDLKKIEDEFRDRVLGSSEDKRRETSLVEEWTETSSLTGFGFEPSERESDRAFYETCVKKLLDEKERSGAIVTAAEFRRRVEAARKEFLLR